MWLDTYPVRLHQPHGTFTAGNIKWTLRVEPSHETKQLIKAYGFRVQPNDPLKIS